MKKFRNKIILLTIAVCFLFSSCDEVESILGLIPKFDGNLPNVISGKFAYYEDEDYMGVDGGYTTLYSFNSQDGTFIRRDATGFSDQIERSGTYEVEYYTFTTTESNGVIHLYYDDGEKINLEFYFKATATKGPEYIKLSDSKTYYYEGKYDETE